MDHIVVGLGNPGERFAGTRHNAGFMVLDALQPDGWSYDRKLDACIAVHGDTLLVKPCTFMNMTGVCTADVLRMFGKGPESLVLVHDDTAFDVGTARLSLDGRAHGHNGLASVILHVGTESFTRLRIGIGRPPREVGILGHVLGRFSDEELARIECNLCPKVASELEQLVKDGLPVDSTKARLKALRC